ncbi:MAG: WD40 repeat domain-containing serine/threonine-protein kinase [Gemmataceae bacterium]|nr:WD40 repeat domain-containing serine/threonine-protein kinase [Gemmata sp.]MDW8196127.1 WD40 repeat domain-containing serine/threonine-protein kinase [Gemmataceae bacterium]
MDSSDSLKIDEDLARFLAAYDQSIEGGEAGPQTIHVPIPPDLIPSSAPERPITPLTPGATHRGSRSEVLPDASAPPASPPPLASFSPAPLVGGPHRIGRFELRRQLGKGGCGIVFLAYDPKLQREVALKIPRPEMLMNRDAKRRLLREALAAAEFDHPNLVPVFETGEIGPLCYIATAFCPGQTLAEWHDRQAFPVPIRQAARLIAIIAEAVQHAHDRGVLHRDLKPNNIILQELKLAANDDPPPGSVMLRGEYFLPRLVDFGLAKLLERGPSETGTRQIVGTPKYMSPEQAQARREDIGPRADVYALGVMLYELLTGRAPYDGASDVEVLRQAVEGKAIPPRHLRPDLPRDLEAICLKAMARDTAERYRTAIDLADDLRRFLDGRPTLARPLHWSGRAVRWLRRNDQFFAILVLTFMVLVIIGLGSWNWYQSRLLRRDHAIALNDRAALYRTEQEREYSRQIRDAFVAWRTGNVARAAGALASARSIALALDETPEFTHDFLRSLLKHRQLMIVCPAGAVTALAVSPDGTRLASGHADGTISVWDRHTGQPLASVPAYPAEVRSLAFACGGRRLIALGLDAKSTPAMAIWQLVAGETTLLRPDSPCVVPDAIYAFAVAPDGQTIVAGGEEGLLVRWDLTNTQPLVAQSRRVGTPAIRHVAVSHNGEWIATCTSRGELRCWTAALRPANNREYHVNEEVTALAITNGGEPLAGLVSGGLWQPQTTQPTVTTGRGRVRWIATSPQGPFAFNLRANRVCLSDGYEFPTGDMGEILAAVYSPDGRTLFTAGEDGIIRSWNLVHDRARFATHTIAPFTHLSLSVDGSQWFAADGRWIRHSSGAAWQNHWEAGSRRIAALRLLPDGTMRIVTFDGTTFILGTPAGKAALREVFRDQLPDHRKPTAAALAANGMLVAIGDSAGHIAVWSVAEKRLLGSVDTGTNAPVQRLMISDSGLSFAAPIPEGIGMWSLSHLDYTVKLEGDEQTVFRFDARRERLITAGRDGAIRLWNADGREETALYGHVGRVTCVATCPDGRTLVSGGSTGEVKFWDMRTGMELLSLPRHSQPVTLMEFSADGQVLITGGSGQMAIWDARE